ncbi:MAG TPA: ABC transporter ATP-binding protein [Anaerolineae bacterium]|nr:ABC transporter ATP-binding protein [Anaerolineae bacterium]
MSQAALRVERVRHTYHDASGHTEALDDISLNIAPGEFVCLVGPSGSGKSTLLRILAGLIRPEAGRIWLDGQLVQSPGRSVGIVFQKANLMPWRTLTENVVLPLEVEGMPLAERQRRASEWIERIGLGGFERTYPGGLSGGMEQRVAIARALISNPSILLLDEPFGSLDALTRERMALELMRIWSAQRTTVVMVTHSIQEAAFLGDRVLVMTPRPGRIAADFPVKLARTRDLSLLQQEAFGELTGRIRATIQAYDEVRP